MKIETGSDGVEERMRVGVCDPQSIPQKIEMKTLDRLARRDRKPLHADPGVLALAGQMNLVWTVSMLVEATGTGDDIVIHSLLQRPHRTNPTSDRCPSVPDC